MGCSVLRVEPSRWGCCLCEETHQSWRSLLSGRLGARDGALTGHWVCRHRNRRLPSLHKEVFEMGEIDGLG